MCEDDIERELQVLTGEPSVKCCDQMSDVIMIAMCDMVPLNGVHWKVQFTSSPHLYTLCDGTKNLNRDRDRDHGRDQK